MRDFDARLDLGFDEFCELVRPASGATGTSGGSGVPNHGETLRLDSVFAPAQYGTGSASTANPRWAEMQKWADRPLTAGVEKHGPRPENGGFWSKMVAKIARRW
jgi:hypothetical protein